MRVCSASRGKYSAIGRPFTRIWPEPGRRRTRATALLRLPVALTKGMASGKAELLRLLGGVRVGRPAVDLELAEHCASERVLGQHQAHRMPDHAVCVRPREEAPGRHLLQVSGVPGVPLVDL